MLVFSFRSYADDVTMEDKPGKIYILTSLKNCFYTLRTVQIGMLLEKFYGVNFSLTENP